MSVIIKLKRGNASNWTSQNTVLASGEPGYELDTGRFKIGNGSTAWNSLPYASVIPSGFVAGSGININLGTNGSTATISVSGLNSTYISDFNEAVDDRVGSGLFAAGTGINLNYNDSGNAFTVSVTGLIANPTNNRILTSRDNTTTGIDAETNLTFDGSLLSVSGNLVANTGNFSIIQLDTDNGPVTAQGQLAWNDTEGTVDIALTDTTIINIGEHEMYRIRNTTGNVLYKGQAVMASGVHSNGIITPSLYTANGSVREIRFMGLVYENVNDNNNGYVIHFGHIYNIDTRGSVASNIAVGDETWSDGDILYVHPTVAGKLTNVEPKHSIAAAIILDAASNGKIFVRPTSYGHLDDNHDVSVSGATNGQFLQYNSVTDYWVPSSSGNFTNLTINNSGVPVGSGIANYSARWTSSNTLGTGILYDNGTNVGIGTSSPNYQLDVSSTGNISTLKFSSIDVSSLPAGTGISNSGVFIFVEPTGVVTTYKITGSGLRSALLDQPATLRFRQGTDAERVLVTFASGEPVWTTDTKKFYIGDGVTAGGLIINGGSGVFTSIEVDNLKLDGNTFSSTSGVIIISPVGTNAIQASSGGNSRGQYALDLQRTRSANTQVAAGQYSTILNGTNNAASGTYDTVLNGQSNIIFGTGSSKNVIGGYNNSIQKGESNFVYGETNTLSTSSTYAYTSYNAIFGRENSVTQSAYFNIGGNVVGGCGNTISGSYNNCNAVFGGSINYFALNGNSLTDSSYNLVMGQNNTLTSTTYGLVVGELNSIGAGDSYSIACGYSNIADGFCSTVIGYDNTGNGGYSSIIGGSLNVANGSYSSILAGVQAKTRLRGEISHSAGGFSAVAGTSQHSILVARRATTDGTANVVLTLDGNSPGASNRLVLPAKTTWTFSVNISAYNDTDSAAAGWIFRGCIRRNGANGTALVGSVIEENWKDVAMASTSGSVVADDTNEALEIRVTGLASKNIRWSAVADLSQVSYGTP